MLEIAEHNKDFNLSNAQGKRRLIKTVFSTIKLTGKKLDFILHSPFDRFTNLSKVEEWLPVSYVLRTLNEYRLALIQATLKPCYVLSPTLN
ncbi:hypothetical protein RHORCCE3_0457 [Rickettsia hoogstraalii str. RCCE3]|nr:hypothetical protein RHORCCE3_0457 [Rickettsia hoogstraalii str. RCCE3]